MAELTDQSDETRGHYSKPYDSPEKNRNAERLRNDKPAFVQEATDDGDETLRLGFQAASEKPVNQNSTWTGIEPQLEEEWGHLTHRGEKKDRSKVRASVAESYERARQRYAALAATVTSGPRDAGGYSIKSDPEELPVDGKTIRKDETHIWQKPHS